MEPCPQCRARLKGGTVSGCCEADLSILQTIEETADILARWAVKALVTGDVPAAARQADAARELYATPFHCAFAGFLEKIGAQEEK